MNARQTAVTDLKGERVIWINDKTSGGGAGKLFKTAAAVLADRGVALAPFFGDYRPGEIDPVYEQFQPAPLGERDYFRFLRRGLGDPGLTRQLDRLRDYFRPTAVVVQNCHKYIGPDVIPWVQRWGIPVILLVNDYGIYCANCYAWRQGEICHACMDHRFSRAIWKGCGLRPGLVTAALTASKTWALSSAWRRDAYRSAHAVLTAGGVFRSRLIEAGFEAEKVVAGIFPHEVTGAEASGQTPPPADLEPSYVYYGSELPIKGQSLILDAIQHLRHACRIRFFVLKPSEDLLSRVKVAAELNPVVKVELDTEARWDSGVREAVTQARAVLVTSVWESPHELVVYEAMALGRAVVVTSCSSNAELIDDGREGLVVNAADPAGLAARLDDLSEHAAEADAMGRRARLRYEERLIPARWADDFSRALATAKKHLAQ